MAGLATTRGVVLLYHAFGHRDASADPHNLFVPPADFRAQLESLLARGWTALTLDGYLTGLPDRSWPRRTFLLTIDDGHASTVEAVPVLADLAVPSVLFIPPAVLGGTSAWMPLMPDSPMLTSAELVDCLAAAPIEVGAHGWDHADLPGMDADTLHRNVVEAADALTALVGYRPRSYAYPRGLFDDEARRAVEQAGYAVCFSTTDSAGRFAIPRIDVNSTDTARTFRIKTSGLWPTVRAVGTHTPTFRSLAHKLIGSARG
jgi:peptidoglycan/xylan/chitin deacetylase (PgdA/CDA1 family)